MRRGVGYVLVALGLFLVVLAPAVKWVVAPKLAVAPLGCTVDPDHPDLCDNGVSISPSSGMATSLFDPATLKERKDVPLVAIRRVRPDVEVSTSAETVYDTFQRVEDSEGTLVDASTARYGFDGHTSEMLDCCGANVGGKPITDVGGVMPLKFGFGVEQQDYEYFDDTLEKSTTASFQGTDEIDGLEVYVFEQVIEPTQIGELEVPGDLVGSSDASYVAPRFYSNTRTMYVEPTTGVIINGEEKQLQTLRGPDGTDQLTLIDATLAFTDDNVAGAVATAEDGKSQLGLITTTIPIALLVLGLILGGLGLFLALGGRQEAAASV